MCGRYGLFDPTNLQERFQTQNDVELTPRYNIAPSQKLPVIINEGHNTIEVMKWGFIPFWAKDPKIGYKMINARADTVATKIAFRGSLLQKRCLVPASGFYEWKQTPQSKQPYYFHLKHEDIFAFAGLYSIWRDTQGTEVKTYTIITTEPNKLVAPIHNRMPVILPRNTEETWLNPDITEPEQLLSLLSPFPDSDMETYPVSPAINNPRNDTPDVIKPL